MKLFKSIALAIAIVISAAAFNSCKKIKDPGLSVCYNGNCEEDITLPSGASNRVKVKVKVTDHLKRYRSGFVQVSISEGLLLPLGSDTTNHGSVKLKVQLTNNEAEFLVIPPSSAIKEAYLNADLEGFNYSRRISFLSVAPDIMYLDADTTYTDSTLDARVVVRFFSHDNSFISEGSLVQFTVKKLDSSFIDPFVSKYAYSKRQNDNVVAENVIKNRNHRPGKVRVNAIFRNTDLILKDSIDITFQ